MSTATDMRCPTLALGTLDVLDPWSKHDGWTTSSNIIRSIELHTVAMFLWFVFICRGQCCGLPFCIDRPKTPNGQQFMITQYYSIRNKKDALQLNIDVTSYSA